MSKALKEFREGVALDLMMLAQLHDRELDGDMIDRLLRDGFPRDLVFRMQGAQTQGRIDTLSGFLSTIPYEAGAMDELAADFASVYLTHGVGASPCESVWLDPDGLAMQEPMFEVRRAYAQHGLQAPDWRKRPDDHLVFQLQFVAALLEEKDGAALSEAARFLDEHTLRWLPDFGSRVAQRAATPFYATLAPLTSTYLDQLRDVLATILDEPRPTAEEVERRTRRVSEEVLPMPGAYVPGGAPSW